MSTKLATINQGRSLTQGSESSTRPTATLSQSDFAKSITEALHMLPAMAAEMPLQTEIQDALPTKHAVLREGVHEDRAPTLKPFVHQSVAHAEHIAVLERANDAVEVPTPLLKE